ncbi:MAG: alkaline phosphatase family protein [Deltaproteobacteria bacterium]|nr:alkaline phosphatase family protein [Deltaproteobacteria bacterium]
MLPLLFLVSCFWDTPAKAPRLIVIGIDGLGTAHLESLDRQGRVPNLAKLARQGVFSEIKSVTPLVSPVIWTSIGSGMRAKKHGVEGWFVDDGSGAPRLVDARHVRVRRYWEILAERGVSTTTLGWLAMFPLAPSSDLAVTTDVFWDRVLVQKVEGNSVLDGDRAPLSLNPRSAASWVLEQRLDPAKAAKGPLGYQFPHTPLDDHPVLRDAWVINTAVESQARDPAEVLTLYVKGIDELAHLFLPFTDAAFVRRMKLNPKTYAEDSRMVPDVDLPWEGEALTDERLEIGARIVDDYLAWLDGALAPVLALAGPDTNIVIVSDHGMLLTTMPPAENGALGIPRPDHDPIATLIMSGPAIKAGTKLKSPSLLDVTPTILHVLGQPVAKDMDGRVLSEALHQPGEVQWVDSYDTRKRTLPEVPALASDPEVERLRALGYVQ